ncbi:glycosyltransferase family 1 protein [Holdemanella biformis]|uniref:glycosyltransferase family 1 protein n=1 Tax=Holdemanella biformis TaxID=1735 RepID=UPI0035621F9E
MQEPIRIVHNIASLHLGGSQAFVMNMYRNIDRSKVQFDFVVTPETKEGFYDEITNLGGKIFSCPRYKGTNHIQYNKWWDDFFNEHPEYKVIHGHVRSTASIYLKIAKRHGLVTIAHSHSTSNGNGISAIVKRIMQLPIRKQADYLFACSDKAGKWLYGEKAITQQNYYMIPNGVDLKRFEFDVNKRNQMRMTLGIKKDMMILGHIGRLSTPKNHKFLLNVFNKYHKINSNSKLLLVGDGELFDCIKEHIDKLNISDAVIMTGSKQNTEDYYQVMDIFVFPSLWEGLPVSVVEAQANGLQCLISDVITHDVDLTDLIQYLPLDEELWLGAIVEAHKKKRMGLTNENIQRLQPFNALTVANKLQEFYLKQDERARR